RLAVLRRLNVLAGHAIDGEEVAVAGGRRDELAGPAVDRRIEEDRRLRRIPVVCVVRRRLEIPLHLPCVDVDGDQRAGEEIVSLAADTRVAGRRVAGAEYIKVGSRI